MTKTDLVSEALAAMQRRELTAYYQPKYDAISGRLRSAEALVRWVRSDGSVVLPGEFLPVLEESGQVDELDWYMAEEVCAFQARLREQGIAPVPISVNFSRWHLHDDGMPERLSAILDAHHLEHELIMVEITESAMVYDEARFRSIVAELHEKGFHVSIDDFGSGLSSLSLVADMLADEIKIDRSLLKKNCEDERERVILESIFHFATRLHMRTVAEGVETKEQLGFLRSCNCGLIQGFYFDRPLPAEQFTERLRSKSSIVPEEDILMVQSEAAAEQLLFDAVCLRYPLIIYINLSRNSFYMMTYENFTSKSCPSTGSFDDLIYHGTASMHPEDRELWGRTFSRENQLKLCAEGRKELHLVTRQIGDDGVYRKVETSNYFVKNPASEDVLAISLCNNLSE